MLQEERTGMLQDSSSYAFTQAKNFLKHTCTLFLKYASRERNAAL
jgi:hypothetical protein